MMGDLIDRDALGVEPATQKYSKILPMRMDETLC